MLAHSVIEKMQITHKGFHTPNFVSLSVNKSTNCCFVFAAYDVKTIKQQGLWNQKAEQTLAAWY